ncbi:MAG: hypothetical protein JWO91_650 [Acidobacteriaceae bacterium]|jgi:hypothetical protein|nr:hypothetical protein [Acidobacteriaceae bacterium]
MTSSPTATDAQVILQLYDLRREAELRKAREWWTQKFWPENYQDYTKVSSAFGTPENNWLRQVMGYWEMAASLANHGAVSADLFLEPSFSGEMFLIFGKLKPFLGDLREKASPSFFSNVEKLINSSEKSRKFLERTESNIANMKIRAAAAAKTS